MAKSIRIELDLSTISGDTNLNDQIASLISEHYEEFLERMNHEAYAIDSRALADEDSLEVDDVVINDSSGVASVRYSYSAYYGCDDMDIYDQIEEDWEFKIINNKLIFDLDLRELERDYEI